MQLHFNFDFESDNEVLFIAQGGANYLRFAPNRFVDVIRESFCGLIPGNQYLQLGSKRRTMFSWTEPAVYNGVFVHGNFKYALFNACLHGGVYWSYAFVVLESNPSVLLQFSNKMNSCRDIVLDIVL